MAASVYATPPPDLSSEDTALSDVSNSSQVSSSSSQSKATKRNISNFLSGSHIASGTLDPNQNDQSKKRRKQSTPIRISATTLNSPFNSSIVGKICSANTASTIDTDKVVVVGSIETDNEHSLPKHIISLVDQPDFQQSLELLERTEGQTVVDVPKPNISHSPLDDPKEPVSQDRPRDNQDEANHVDEIFDEDAVRERGFQKDQISRKVTMKCEQCDEWFDSELKLGVHIIQCHSGKSEEIREDGQQNDVEAIARRIKIEPDLNGQSVNDSRLLANIPRPEDWLTMSTLNFPFPPEAAAAALSAGNYLSQLPLLSVPPVGPFPSVEGLSRPPLRIFNPEAYCDLCNKEFCNKYFLKTHKANKHGIYDPTNSSNDSPTTSQINQITHALQLQFQQQQHQQLQHQQQSQPPSQHQLQSQQEQSSAGADLTIFCDICHKRFTNVFAMKRHRNKAHEIPPPTSPQLIKTESDAAGWNDKENTTPMRVPEGFREDFSIEQEDASFTPQPRKLSPTSIQQAREANFSVEKLKRLGVVNPEAFCDLCCKEYCNKYFLRTHKLKRHGILVPADDIREDKLLWQSVQTTPLNLMVGAEKARRKSTDPESGIKLAKPDSDEVSLKSSTSENEITSKESVIPATSADKNVQLFDVSGIPQDPDAISIDLQKLQSMILQLNDLSNQRPMTCHLCGKELENQYMLHAHITTDHSVDNNNLANKSPRSLSPTASGFSQSEVCKHCEKEFNGVPELKQHIFEMHGMQLNSPIREGFVTPERPIATQPANLPPTPTQPERRPPYTITPTSSYCEICNKELCNKYFMKTHMQRMHGIEIENGAQIGGVVCNICNKELCSKYFLRVHKHNTHGIVEEGSPLPQSRQNGEQQEMDSLPFSIDPTIKSDLADISNRYFTHYTEVCPLCSRRFRSSKWLRAHLMSDHGKSGTEKLRELEQQMSFRKSSSPTLKIPNGGGLTLSNLDANLLTKGAFPSLVMHDETVNASQRLKEYQCSICSFSTPYYAFLFIHERSHSFISNPSPPASLKSENAVSIAKDQQRAAQPSNPAATTGTPTLTPASTPAPQTPQENANGNKREGDGDRDCESEHDPAQEKGSESNVEPFSASSLISLANITNRPTSYAMPQKSNEQEIMQSFFMEECVFDCNTQRFASASAPTSAPAMTSDANSTNKASGNNKYGKMHAMLKDVTNSCDNSGTGDGNSSENDHEAGTSGSNRFVPAIVFLPVRERVSGPITVSFTLTPA